MKQRPVPAHAGMGRCCIIICIVSSVSRLTVLPPATPSPAHATSSGSPLDSRWKVRSCRSRCPLRRRVLTLLARCGLLRRGATIGAPLAAETDLDEGRGRHHRHRRLLGGRDATSHGEEVIDLRFLSPGGEGHGQKTPLRWRRPETPVWRPRNVSDLQEMGLSERVGVQDSLGSGVHVCQCPPRQ